MTTPETKYSHFAQPKVDLRKRQAMISFLLTHNGHYDGAEFTPSYYHFAHCIKLAQLELGTFRSPLYMKAAVMSDLMTEDEGAWGAMEGLFEAWSDEHARLWRVVFTGRSGGWLELQATSNGTSGHMERDYSDWSMADLRQRVRLVESFDQLCDAAVALFMDYALAYPPEAPPIEVEIRPPSDYDEWYRQVDALIMLRVGVGVDDLTDGPSRDAFDDGTSAADYASDLLCQQPHR